MSLTEKAKDLLGEDAVTSGMVAFLEETERLCKLQGGMIISRQIAALAIATAHTLYGENGVFSRIRNLDVTSVFGGNE